jgi:TldD protein
MNLIDQSLKELGIETLSRAEVEPVLELALSRGGTLAELFFEETHATRVTIDGGRLDEIVDGIDRGVGLRILFDNRSVYGYTTQLTRESLEALAAALSAAVTETGGPGSVRKDWREAIQRDSNILGHRVERSPKSLPMAGKIDLVRRGEQAARRELPDARQVSSVLIDSLRRICIINSDGIVARDSKTYLTYVCEVVGEKDGRTQSAYEVEGGYVGLEFFDQHPPEEVATECARRVKVLLSAEPAPAGTMPVVLAAEAGGTMIHEAVGHGLEADLACNGLSVYQGKVGQQVASPLITVVDDGTMPGRRGSYAYDDEGNPSQKTTLIENGILKGYLVDRISAMKFDMPSTGNGRRESFRHRPMVRMTNTYIAPGSHDPAQILAETKQGIYVRAMGGGQVNTVTGDFVFAVTEGYLIRDGKLGAPIRGATLVGNGPKVMMEVDRVGSDFGFALGTCGKDGQGAPVTDAQPTIRIPAMTVGGEVPMEKVFGSSSG